MITATILTTATFADRVVRLIENYSVFRAGSYRDGKSWTVEVEYSREAASTHGMAGYQRTCVLFSEAADLFDEFVAAYSVS